MIAIHPVTLQGNGVRLEPLALDHHDALAMAAADGRLWELWFTSVPGPGETVAYIEEALARQRAGHHLAFAVRDATTDAIVGTTSYHDIMSAIDRVEIGWTWYAASHQRTHVNTSCKLLLLTHAFETLGAKKDGVLRHHHLRRDGTVRDSVMYSILATEWPDVRRHLESRLARHLAPRAWG